MYAAVSLVVMLHIDTTVNVYNIYAFVIKNRIFYF